jgi:UDP-N-acetylglucosamine 3-dehydrogenase
MARDRLRIGLVGAGAMGAAHAGAYADMEDVEVVGVFSRDRARAEATAAICGATALDDAAALIGDPAIEAIDVCVPSAVHEAFVIPALKASKPVFCETPLALDLKAARRMRDAARSAGRLLQVGLLMRSVAPYEHVRGIVESGEHGRLLSLTTWRLGSYLRAGAPDHKAHYSDPSTELMTFDFDFAGWLMGAPKRLSATAAGRIGDAPGEISALLDYGDDRHVTVLASGIMPPGHPFTVGFRALFEGAMFELNNVFADDGPPESRFTVSDDAGPRDVGIGGHDPYEAELRRFAACVRSEADPALLDVERAIEALTLSIATQRALRHGGVVEMAGAEA